MTARIGRALRALGVAVIETGHSVGRRLHWATGAALTRVGLRLHLAGHRLVLRGEVR